MAPEVAVSWSSFTISGLGCLLAAGSRQGFRSHLSPWMGRVYDMVLSLALLLLVGGCGAWGGE
ncbi:hypothetical protein IWX91DRAFT_353053 [Phyllosticta citricarpa]